MFRFTLSFELNRFRSTKTKDQREGTIPSLWSYQVMQTPEFIGSVCYKVGVRLKNPFSKVNGSFVML